MKENFLFFHTAHSVEIRNFLLYVGFFSANVYEKFREINLVSKGYSKMVLEMTQLRSFGANLRKYCCNMPKSRRFEDLKSIEKIGIHWTQTKLSEYEVAQFQLQFTDY